MVKIRRGNFIFITYIGDHTPRHVHVYKDDDFLGRWNLEENSPIDEDKDRFTSQLKSIIQGLIDEGRL